MKSVLKLCSVLLGLALFAASCGKGGNSAGETDPNAITTIEGQLGAPGDLNGYVELVPGTVKLEYDQISDKIVFNAKVKVLKAAEAIYPEMNIQLLDEDGNVIDDFELHYDSRDVLVANLAQSGNIANLKFCNSRGLYERDVAESVIEDRKGVAKHIVISMSKGKVTPLEEASASESATSQAFGVGSHTVTGTVAGKEVSAVFDIAESGSVRGGYHYGKGTSQDMIELKGSFDSNDNSMVVKEEFDGKVTGTWDITLSENPDGSISFNGTMTNYKGNTYPVILTTQGEGVEDVEVAMPTASSNNNIDELLDEYDNYVTKLVNFYKKAMSGDISALNDYQDLMESCEELNTKLINVQGQMTSSQLSRFEKIVQKMTSLY